MYFIPNSLKYRSNSATYCALPYFYIISLKAYLVPSMTSFSNRKAVKAKVHSFMPKASLHLRLALSLLCHLQLNGIFSGGAIHNFVNIVTIRCSRNGILLPKLFWPTVRKKCSSDQETLLKFEAEGREFAKCLRSLEQFI